MFTTLLNHLKTIRQSRRLWIIGGGIATILVIYGLSQAFHLTHLAADPRSRHFITWGTGNEASRAALITEQRERCPGAPFILPADGYIGLFYADPRAPYSTSNRHQGIDIFSPGEPGTTPIYAAYDGYVTREETWRSSLIIRVPEDPFDPTRQIWLYYTHMADKSGTADFISEAFPPGTREFFVEQGTLLGYTGNFSGNPLREVWVHLHFSVVLDDGNGFYTNELEFDNTIDPSRYLGMAVNYACAESVPACTLSPLCEEAILGAGGG
nr:M23 family metallopeptidase [Anaerolineae bacterium]